MRDDEFEWDDRKARANLDNHKISFEDARLVFLDPFGQEKFDDREDYGEDRSVRIGMANGVLFVVTVTTRGNRVRIISARKGTKREQADYDRQFT